MPMRGWAEARSQGLTGIAESKRVHGEAPEWDFAEAAKHKGHPLEWCALRGTPGTPSRPVNTRSLPDCRCGAWRNKHFDMFHPT
jgi:hypothetical protein